jgi:hypothetical protein
MQLRKDDVALRYLVRERKCSFGADSDTYAAGGAYKEKIGGLRRRRWFSHF